MIRTDIITTVGRKYLTSNIENEEFSYGKALKAIGKDYTNFLSEDARRVYKDLDIRFANDKLSILIETKQNLYGKDLENGIIQLQNYINFEHELSNNQVVAILASTNQDKIFVWYDIAENISIDNYKKTEKKIKTFKEYENIFFGTKNDKLKIIQNTYDLNELLHKYGIKEKIRSQFVGTCLLALKNGLIYKGLSTIQIIAGVKENLSKLLNNNLNKARKLVLLDNNVLNSQDVTDLKNEQMQEILDTIKNNILPFINDESTQGQDLLNLFFTTFNKYVGKADKNQAFTPDHITQFMCHVVNVNKNSRVLDLCSAPGGKTTHIATLMENTGEVVSRDIFDHKLKLIKNSVDRLGLTNVKIEKSDASIIDKNIIENFDYVLCDVPCSGLGIIKRKPEIKYKSKEEIKDLPKLQYDILENASKYLKVGGVLIYSTCTILDSENISNVYKFLENNKNFELSKINEVNVDLENQENGYLKIYPNIHNMDGFFIAKLKKVR